MLKLTDRLQKLLSIEMCTVQRQCWRYFNRSTPTALVTLVLPTLASHYLHLIPQFGKKLRHHPRNCYFLPPKIARPQVVFKHYSCFEPILACTHHYNYGFTCGLLLRLFTCVNVFFMPVNTFLYICQYVCLYFSTFSFIVSTLSFSVDTFIYSVDTFVYNVDTFV